MCFKIENCSGAQNLTRTKTMIRVQTTEGFPQDIHNSQSLSQSLRHIQHSLQPKDISDLESHSTILRPFPLQGLYHPEVLIVSGSSSIRTLPVPKISTLNLKIHNRSSLNSPDNYVAPFFPTFITCTPLSEWAVMDSDRFFDMQS